MRERYVHLDIIAGVLILYMIFVHVCQIFGYDGSLVFGILQHFFGFFMPWFFFKGGIVYKQKDTTLVFWEGFKRLIKPYIVWTIIGVIVLNVIRFINGDSINILKIFKGTIYGCVMLESVRGNLPLWFLITLYATRLLFNFCMNKNISPYIIIGICFIAGYGLYLSKWTLPIWIANTFTATMFYGLGYVLKNSQYGKNQMLISATIFVVINIFDYTYVGIRKNVLIEGDYAIWPLFAVSGIILFNNIFFYLVKNRAISSHFNIFFYLSHIGRMSMYIYVLHWPILIILQAII